MARLDTGWHAHPRIMRLTVAGMAAHAWSISYCDHALTDGFIPMGAWPSKHGFSAGVRELVGAGLWTQVEGGYQLHDYTDYNRTRAQVESLRAAKQAIGQAGGQASARARAQAKAQANGQQTLKQNPTPGPGPGNSFNSLTTAGHATREVDPKLVAEHLDRIARERATRQPPPTPGKAGVGVEKFLSETKDE